MNLGRGPTVTFTLPDGRSVHAPDVHDHSERFTWTRAEGVVRAQPHDGRIETRPGFPPPKPTEVHQLARGWEWYVLSVAATTCWGLLDVNYNGQRIARLGGPQLLGPAGYKLTVPWSLRALLDFDLQYTPVGPLHGPQSDAEVFMLTGVLLRRSS